jgi:hypothetical protein
MMETRFVQIIPGNTFDNNVNTMFALDAQGAISGGAQSGPVASSASNGPRCAASGSERRL